MVIRLKKKLKIGMFIDTFFPMLDGVIMVVDNYAKRLADIADVIVFAPSIPHQDFDDSKFKYKVVRCKSLHLNFMDYSLPIPKLDKKFMRVLDSYDLDIVHIHSPFMLGKVGVEYAKKRNIPSFGTIHSQIKQDFKRVVKLEFLASLLTSKSIQVYDKCDKCFTVNPVVAGIYHNEYGYKTMPSIISNATEMEPLKNKSEAVNYINSKYNIKKDEYVFLFVGRLNALKNIFLIVDSLKVLKSEHPNFKFKMLFVGFGQDEDALKEQIKKENMDKSIILCGRIDDRGELAKYYARADLFLFPSMYDTNSLVQIEAASQSTPTLFVTGSATSGTVTEDVNGFFAENNANDYAKAIFDILNDKKLYDSVSKNAYRDLYKNWDMVVKDVYEEYVKSLEEKQK